MTHELALLAASCVLALVQLIVAAQLATASAGWPGMRAHAMKPSSHSGRWPAAGTAPSGNLMETFPLFVAAVLIASVTGTHSALSVGGAHIYFWGRVLYVPLYATGLPYIRSGVWAMSVFGILLVLAAPFVAGA